MGIPAIAQKAAIGRDRAYCRFPDCGADLMTTTRSGHPYFQGDLAHIRSPKPGGPRYDPDYPPLLLNAVVNIVCLCRDHHREVDLAANVPHYPAESMQKWIENNNAVVLTDDLRRKLIDQLMAALGVTLD
jgi:hypothetical protein